MKISMIPNKIVKLIHASKGDTSLRKWAFEPYDNNGAINVSNIKDQLVYKTENGGTEQLLPVNTSTPTTSYFDGTINYGTDTDVEFTYKQSSYTGQARIKSIKGNTLVWNQLVKKVTVSTTINGVAITSTNNGTITLSGTSTDVVSYFIELVQPIKSGDMAIIVLGNSVATNDNIYVRLHNSSGHYSKGEFACPANVLNNRKIITVPDKGLNDENVSEWNYIQLRMNSGITVNMTVMPQIFDVTKIGISSLDEFSNLFPLNYYAPSLTLLNFNGTGIKTVGFNRADIDNVFQGSWNDTGGTSSGATRVSIPSIIVRGISKIYVKSVFGFWIRYMRTDTEMISGSNWQTTGEFTLPDGTDHILLTFRRNSNNDNISVAEFKTENAELCVNVSDSSKNGTYEPYTTSTTSLPISTYFPTGMKSAGTVYDELSDKAITRVGSVDLGSLTWNYVGGRFQSTDLNGLIHDYTTLESPNITCAKYPTFIANYTSQTTFGITAFKGSGVMYLRVLDSAYSDSATFKTAMSGVYLNYELATYTETDIQNASLVCKNIEVPCYLSSGNLVCDATEELTNESGFFDAKLKLKDSSSVAYSSKFKLHVEDL